MKRFISSRDTVALFSEGPTGFVEEWRGPLIDWFVANDMDAPREVLAVVKDLEATGAHRTGGGAAPIFELRLVASAL